MTTMAIHIATFLPLDDTFHGHQPLDTTHIIESGGNTKSNQLFPAQLAAKSHVWNTLQYGTL